VDCEPVARMARLLAERHQQGGLLPVRPACCRLCSAATAFQLRRNVGLDRAGLNAVARLAVRARRAHGRQYVRRQQRKPCQGPSLILSAHVRGTPSLAGDRTRGAQLSRNRPRTIDRRGLTGTMRADDQVSLQL
jgi:hypothetical protein